MLNRFKNVVNVKSLASVLIQIYKYKCMFIFYERSSGNMKKGFGELYKNGLYWNDEHYIVFITIRFFSVHVPTAEHFMHYLYDLSRVILNVWNIEMFVMII